MARKQRFVIVVALLVIALGVLNFSRENPDPTVVVVDTFRKTLDIPGAVVAFGSIGNAPEVVALGVADPNTGLAMSPDQVFRLASLTKPVAAAALIARFDAGELDPDQPLMDQANMPAPLDARARSITMHDLLGHRGGFDRTTSFDPVFAPDRVQKTEAASCEELATAAWTALPLDFEPGSDTAYSNIGYCLMTGLFSGATGQEMEAALQAVADLQLVGDAGKNWVYSENQWNPAYVDEASRNWLSGLGLAGGGLSTADGYWRFAAQEHPARSAAAPVGEEADFYAL